MSEKMKRDALPLDLLLEEARAEREPPPVRDLDWSAIEARVMTRIAEEPAQAPSALTARRKILRGATVALAIAATTILYLRRQPAPQPAGQSAPIANVTLPAAAEASSFKSGELHVGGAVAQPGFTIHEGDALSVAKERALLERSGAVSWLIEAAEDGDAARVRVTSAGRPLVLSLEHGAIEAQVVPVKEGEAFAVDVATANSVVRVAVHGTHLRVARAGDRVVVDLTEGVIAIGAPPKQGLTTGTTVTAPAHVELDASDLATLRVDHTPASVRAAIPLGEHATATAPPTTSVAASTPTPAPRASSAKVEPPKPSARSARESIGAAVRQCAVTHAKSGAVRVSVTSDLTLTVSPEGAVTLAKFDPPLPPEVQSCAAETIYKTKLVETGVVSVPIEFSY